MFGVAVDHRTKFGKRPKRVNLESVPQHQKNIDFETRSAVARLKLVSYYLKAARESLDLFLRTVYARRPDSNRCAMQDFEKLAKTLFEGDVIASDFKTMPGTNTKFSRDHLAKSLLNSMRRMGLIVDGKLVDEMKPKN